MAERGKAGEGELRAALGHVYVRVQVPTGLGEDGSLRFASRELATILAAGRSLHERVREALETHVATRLYPAKVAALAQLGPEREWRWVREIAQALPQFLDRPKVWTPDALAAGIAEGVAQGLIAYAPAATEADGTITVEDPTSIVIRRPLSPDQVALGERAVLISLTLAEHLTTQASGPAETLTPAGVTLGSTTTTTGAAAEESDAPPSMAAAGAATGGLWLEITATKDDLFLLNRTLSKLRDLLDGGNMRVSHRRSPHSRRCAA